MFGYVKPYTPELRLKDYEFYKSTYCGVCRAMKKYTGALSNVGLSYDSVALALVRMLFIPDTEIGAVRKRCIAHPLKSRVMLKDNSALEYTARAFAILTYHKLLDDINDEGALRKMARGAVKPIYKSANKKAGLSEMSKLISEKLSAINELERAETKSIDEPADLFGELLGELFSSGLSEKDRLVCYEFGYHLGRFIYSADAAEDYDGDRRDGKYNPYVLLYGGAELTEENKKNIKTALILECKMMENAVNLLPFGKKRTIENIIKNLIYDGLPKRIEFLGG
jgi:hypothetical protein